MRAVPTTVFEIDAIGKTVSAVTGCGLSTLVRPNPRNDRTPSFDTPNAAFDGYALSGDKGTVFRESSALRGVMGYVPHRDDDAVAVGHIHTGRTARARASVLQPTTGHLLALA